LKGSFRINDVTVEQMRTRGGKLQQKWVVRRDGMDVLEGKDFAELCGMAVTIALAPAKEAPRSAGEFPTAGGPE